MDFFIIDIYSLTDVKILKSFDFGMGHFVSSVKWNE